MTRPAILGEVELHERAAAATALLPADQGRRISEVAHSHEHLRAELYRARRFGQSRIVLAGDDLHGYEFGADLELADRHAFVLNDRIYLVGTLDVLAALGHTVLAEIATARAR